MDLRERATDFVKALPVAHRVGIIAAVALVAMAGTVFAQWVTTPSFTVLYSGMDSAAVAGVVDELETLGVPYQLGGGGGTVLVPREQLYTTRATLAQAGIAGESVPEGYELLQEQGLSVSDFRQRVDYQRALEGEIAKTLMGMDAINTATVKLVMPEDELFSEEQEPVTASVLIDPTRPLDESEVEAITFLVTSSVEGLGIDSLTVADTKGTVLHAPGEAGGASVATNRNLRQTREFEQAMAADVAALLGPMGDGQQLPNVVVRATLDFNETETLTETFNPDNQVTTSEQTSSEVYTGTGAPPGGAVGVDGGPLPAGGEESDYQKQDALREFGVDKTTQTSVAAPGRVQKLSVAIVQDDGSITGAKVPPVADVELLVSAALGLDAARGDTVAVNRLPFPLAEEEVEEALPEPGMLDQAGQYVGIAVLGLVGLALFLMTRRKRSTSKDIELAPGSVVIDLDGDAVPASATEPVPANLLAGEPTMAIEGQPHLKDDVTALVQRQPEEIATLLRSWLADRRA